MWVIGSRCVPEVEFYVRIICKQQQSAKYDFRHGKTRPIPSFICLLARLALLCVVNRISELRATNKIPTIKSFPCFFSATTTIPSKEKRKKKLFHHSRTQKSEAEYERDSSSAKRAACSLQGGLKRPNQRLWGRRTLFFFTFSLKSLSTNSIASFWYILSLSSPILSRRWLEIQMIARTDLTFNTAFELLFSDYRLF